TTTCQVGKLEFSTEHVSMGGFPNLSARNAIEINLYTINPKGIKLLCKPGADGTNGTNELGNFRLQNDDGNLEVDNYSETLVDPTHIRIRANLRDDSEGQKITLSGCLWPENRAEFAEADLKAQSPELFYSQTFIQNTPPDNVKNMYVSDGLFSSSVKKCYLSFEVPDQSLKRNLDSKYEIGYYLRENDGKLYFKGSETLTLDQRRNPSGGNVFQYYFDGQEDDLTSYEYTVQVLGPHGRNSEKLSTDPALGVCVLVEPTVTIEQTPNGLFDESYECYEVESASDSITFTATPGQEGDTLTVKDNGAVLTATGGHYSVSGSGRHTIEVVSKRVGARAVTVTKKIRIEKTPDAAEIEFGKAFNGCGTDASGFEYIEVASLAGTVSYTATAPEEGTTVSVTDNGTAVLASGSLNVSSHTLVATVHKDFCNDVSVTKKVKVVRELQKPTYSFNPGLTGTTTDDFEWIEVADGSSFVTYTITAESGCTMTVHNSYVNKTTNTSGNTNTDTLVSLSTSSSRDYTLTITVKKPCYTDKTFTKKIKLIKALQEPTITVYKNDGNDLISPSTSAPEESGYSAYTCYDMPLTTSGTGHANFEVTAAADGGSVSVKVDGANVSTYSSNKRKLELGGHIITFTVTKTGYKTQEYNKKVYVQGTLAEPTIDSVNGIGSATGSGNSNTDPLVWKFSYINYDSLKCKITAGNTGNTVKASTTVTGSSVSLSKPTEGFGVGYDTVAPIIIVQTKAKCKTKTTTKYVQGKIKPIKLWYRNGSAGGLKGYQAIYIKNFGANNYDLYGDVFTKLNSGGESVIFSYGRSEYPITANTWDHLNSDSSGREVVYICTSPNDKITLRMNNMRRRKHDDEGSVTGEKERML
ncbi:MAG: hypothetical protein IJJ66_10340, partial [Treponema sp.]|nr:hypothetical protein [Treponema sp.]